MGEINLMTGSQNLIQAVATWLLIIIPIGAAAAMGYYSLLKMFNEGDPQQTVHYNRAMKNVVIAAVIGVAASGLITGVIAYFK